MGEGGCPCPAWKCGTETQAFNSHSSVGRLVRWVKF